MKSFLIVFYTFLLFFTAGLLASLPVSAETVTAASYALAGYTGGETDVFAPAADSGIRRLDMTAPWDFLGDTMHIQRHIRNGNCTAYAILDTDECIGETTFTLELADDLSEYNVLCFGVGFTSRAETPSPIRAELELIDYSGSRAVSKVELQMPEEGTYDGGIWWNLLRFDLSGFEGRNDTVKLNVTFTYDPTVPPNVLRITNPYMKAGQDTGFANAERYLTNAFTSETGVISIRSGAVRPDDRGQVRLTGSVVLAEQPDIGTEAFLEVRVSRVRSGGLTVGLGYENGEAAYAGQISLTSGPGETTEAYTVPITIYDRLQTLELAFDNIVCDAYFRIESVRLYYDNTMEGISYPELGKVTSLIHSGDAVIFSGEMKRTVVLEHSGASLRFYAVPGWSSDDLTTAVEIGQTKLSNRFDYTADLTAYPYLTDTYRFFAGLVTAEGELLPLSRPVYPDASEIPEQALSNVGLYDAAAVGVFESNVSHVIVDVLLDRLLTDPQMQNGDTPSSLSYTVYQTEETEDGSRVIRSRTAQTPVNHTVLKELDNEIQFYISAGLEVYLRITSESAIPGLTYEKPGAQEYAVCPETPEARHFYAAIVRYLCRRYSGIGGLVLGSPVNLGTRTGAGSDDTDAAVYAHNLAELCRITYNTASSERKNENDDLLVVIPFGTLPEESEESAAFFGMDPKSLTVMMASYLRSMGTVPWVMLYCTEDMTDILGTDLLETDLLNDDAGYSDGNSVARRARQLTDELALHGSAAIMYFYEPTYEQTNIGYERTRGMSGYSEYLAEMFARLCGSTWARAVFLSMDRLNVHLDHEFYSFLKQAEGIPDTLAGTDGRRRAVVDFQALSASEAEDRLNRTASRYSLWDFSNSFHPLGWIAGGGVSSCLTVYSDLFSLPDAERYSRVLRSAISVDADSVSDRNSGMAAGISLRNLIRTVDMSEVDYIEFTFALNHPGLIMGTGHESGTVVFLLGSDDRRAEFKVAAAVPEQVLTYVCDLSDYEFRDQVDFMGVMVYADHDVYFDLASVKVYSNTLSPAELAEVFRPNPAEEEPVIAYEAVILVSVIVFVLSVSAAVLLIRHDAEEYRERRKQERILAEKRSRYQRIRR